MVISLKNIIDKIINKGRVDDELQEWRVIHLLNLVIATTDKLMDKILE